MAKKQTRRSISCNRSLFQQATDYARDVAGVPLSQLCAEGLRMRMGLPPVIVGAEPQTEPVAAS